VMHNPIEIKVINILLTFDHTRFGYEVPGIVLFHNLKGAMRFDHSKDMSLDVSTCTRYDFKTLIPIMWKLY